MNEVKREKERGEIVGKYPALHPIVQSQNPCIKPVLVYAPLEMYQLEDAE